MSGRMIIMANNIDEVGGAQRVAHSLAQGFAERGFTVDLVGMVPHEPRHQFTAEPAYRSITLAERPLPSASDSAGRQRARTAILRSLQSLIDAGEPGIIITTQLWAMEFLEEVDHRGWRIIGQYHSSFEAAAGGRDLARAQKSYADVDAFVLLTDEDAESFRRAGLNNTCWIPNAVSFRPADTAALDTRVLTYLGRLSPEKGPQFLVEAWGRIAAQHRTGHCTSSVTAPMSRQSVRWSIDCPKAQSESSSSRRSPILSACCSPATSSCCPPSSKDSRSSWPRPWPAGCPWSRQTARPECVH